jgi:hypothetical protein
MERRPMTNARRINPQLGEHITTQLPKPQCASSSYLEILARNRLDNERISADDKGLEWRKPTAFRSAA